MAPRPKRPCACGCGHHVSRKVELGHLNGQRSALLAASVLSQNRSLLCSRKQASKAQRMSPARRAGKQELIGRPAPVRQALSSRKTPLPGRYLSESPSGETDDFPMSEAGPSRVHRDSLSPVDHPASARQASLPDRPLSESPSGEIGGGFLEYDHLPMSESVVRRDSPSPIDRLAPARQALPSRKAFFPDKPLSKNPSGETAEAFLEHDHSPMREPGPSGFDRDSPAPALPRTVHFDESLSTPHSPTHVIQDLPPRSSPMPSLPDADGYGLSTLRRSRRITERVERIGQVRWGRNNHVQFIEREEREDDEDDEDEEGGSSTEGNLNMEDGEDRTGCDDDEFEDEDMPFAEPGQEGISVWDLLGEGFLKEAAELGWYLLTQF